VTRRMPVDAVGLTVGALVVGRVAAVAALAVWAARRLRNTHRSHR
jgi:hypothetical protein